VQELMQARSCQVWPGLGSRIFLVLFVGRSYLKLTGDVGKRSSRH